MIFNAIRDKVLNRNIQFIHRLEQSSNILGIATGISVGKKIRGNDDPTWCYVSRDMCTNSCLDKINDVVNISNLIVIMECTGQNIVCDGYKVIAINGSELTVTHIEYVLSSAMAYAHSGPVLIKLNINGVVDDMPRYQDIKLNLTEGGLVEPEKTTWNRVSTYDFLHHTYADTSAELLCDYLARLKANNVENHIYLFMVGSFDRDIIHKTDNIVYFDFGDCVARYSSDILACIDGIQRVDPGSLQIIICDDDYVDLFISSHVCVKIYGMGAGITAANVPYREPYLDHNICSVYSPATIMDWLYSFEKLLTNDTQTQYIKTYRGLYEDGPRDIFSRCNYISNSYIRPSYVIITTGIMYSICERAVEYLRRNHGVEGIIVNMVKIDKLDNLPCDDRIPRILVMDMALPLPLIENIGVTHIYRPIRYYHLTTNDILKYSNLDPFGLYEKIYDTLI